MRKRNVSNHHDSAPMCADPPHRTWEPDHHTPRSSEKPTIPTKTNPSSCTSPRLPCATPKSTTPANTPQPIPRPPQLPASTPVPTSHAPTHTAPPHTKTPGTVPDALTHHNLKAETYRSRAGSEPISARSTTDLDEIRREGLGWGRRRRSGCRSGGRVGYRLDCPRAAQAPSPAGLATSSRAVSTAPTSAASAPSSPTTILGWSSRRHRMRPFARASSNASGE